jgi:hypothetical protein
MNALSLLRQQNVYGEVRFSGQYVDSDLSAAISSGLLARIYRFSAERFGLGDCKFGASDTLAPDARNLAEVLNTLQPNSDSFAAYLALVQRVLPQIKWVSVIPQSSSGLRVMVWNFPKESMRDDLAIPLIECGTGIGQVLSILYVAYFSHQSRVLLIDEPQSFLHPGAARKLIEVLKEFPHHQYIVATHSPTVISAADPKQIIIARQIEGQTELEVADAKVSQNLSQFLIEVGSQLSDVFGMDRVVWVEGPTEVRVFTKLLEKVLQRITATIIVPIRNTGDLEGKDARKFLEMYRNLTNKQSLLPRVVRFLLDRESRSPQELDELKKLGFGSLEFLPSRMIENYFFEPVSILVVLNNIEGFNDGQPVTMENLSKLIEEEILKDKYWAPEPLPTTPSLDNPALNGAALFATIFSILSNRRVRFDKTLHGPKIVEQILETCPEKLDGLKTWLETVLD